jgi:quercetin dioxygenase-like cupin family protein
MGLKISTKEMSAGTQMVSLKGGNMKTFHIFGSESSMMLATRAAGYHSRPHIHQAEQLNYCLAGEMFIFIEGVPYLFRQGEFLRIPSMAVHWAWNRSDGDCTILQSFAPGHQITRPGSVGLFDEGEKAATEVRSRNFMVSDEYMTEPERKAFPKG